MPLAGGGVTCTPDMPAAVVSPRLPPSVMDMDDMDRTGQDGQVVLGFVSLGRRQDSDKHLMEQKNKIWCLTGLGWDVWFL